MIPVSPAPGSHTTHTTLPTPLILQTKLIKSQTVLHVANKKLGSICFFGCVTNHKKKTQLLLVTAPAQNLNNNATLTVSN